MHAAPTPLEQVKALAVSAHRKQVEAQALPGETFEQAQRRFLRNQDLRPPTEQPVAATQEAPLFNTAQLRTSLRKAPKHDSQADLFIPAMVDLSTKDSRSLMDVAICRISKRDKRAGETLRHELSDGYVEIKAGPDGMASIWDYDIVLMGISHLVEAAKPYRAGKGPKPPAIFRPQISEILKFCKRSSGGRQYEEIEAALDRLKGTTVKFVRTRPGRSGKTVREVDGESLIATYRTLSYAQNGRLMSVEIELPKWIYQEVVDSQRPDVLTMDPAYFLIESGIGRLVYRLARAAAGRGSAKWSFETIFQRSGSTGAHKKFVHVLRQLIKANDLPEYVLREEAGVTGPQLVMTHRAAHAACGS